MSQFIGKVRNDIQHHLKYPAMAKQTGMQGRVRVAFTLVGDHARHIKILKSSGESLLNQGAIKTVRKTLFPSCPQKLHDKCPMHMTLWVKFSMN